MVTVPAGDGDWRPIPDPTVLTTAQLRRELASLRELIEARLDGMDKATSLLSETVHRTPTVIQTDIGHLREIAYERFSSIATQFAERDTRTAQAAKASKEALDAALMAAKELVAQQNAANAQAAEKVEATVAKQMDQIGLRIEAMREGSDARLNELKERIDRGEPATAAAALGQAGHRSDATYAQSATAAAAAHSRATAGIVVAGLAVFVTIAVAVLTALHG